MTDRVDILKAIAEVSDHDELDGIVADRLGQQRLLEVDKLMHRKTLTLSVWSSVVVEVVWKHFFPMWLRTERLCISMYISRYFRVLVATLPFPVAGRRHLLLEFRYK